MKDIIKKTIKEYQKYSLPKFLKKTKKKGRAKVFNKKNQTALLTAISILLFIFAIPGISSKEKDTNEKNIPAHNELTQVSESHKKLETTIEEHQNTNYVVDGLIVHFIDVGQGDSILIQQGSSAMLIDAGEKDKGQQVVNYIKDQAIDSLDYIIATHPHSDHIGGLSDVINTFAVGKIIMSEAVHTTQTFENLLFTIQSKGLKITKTEHGLNLDLGDAILSIIGPISISNENLNNASVVCKISYGEVAFLFTGDAEKESEAQIISAGYDIGADVLKVAHHGSDTSSSDVFLSEVKPNYAVIMSESDNSYGHPHQEVLDRLTVHKAQIYRTDLLGTIVFTSDGKTVQPEITP